MNQDQQSMEIMRRLHSERRMVALESIQVVANDALRSCLQWRASAIGDANDTVHADGSSPLEVLTALHALVYPSGSRRDEP